MRRSCSAWFSAVTPSQTFNFRTSSRRLPAGLNTGPWQGVDPNQRPHRVSILGCGVFCPRGPACWADATPAQAPEPISDVGDMNVVFAADAC